MGHILKGRFWQISSSPWKSLPRICCALLSFNSAKQDVKIKNKRMIENFDELCLCRLSSSHHTFLPSTSSHATSPSPRFRTSELGRRDVSSAALLRRRTCRRNSLRRNCRVERGSGTRRRVGSHCAWSAQWENRFAFEVSAALRWLPQQGLRVTTATRLLQTEIRGERYSSWIYPRRGLVDISLASKDSCIYTCTG